MKNSLIFVLLASLLLISPQVYAQFGEPPVKEKDKPRNLFDEGYKSGFGFTFNLSDFGFGAGGQFRKGLSSYTELTATFKIASLRDPSEQTFVDYNFGFRTIPNKYKRVISFPLYIGLKKRIFAEDISDNFRVFTTMAAGPVYALSYAYFKDSNNNGFRENNFIVFGFEERINDIFTGFDDSASHWGFGGEAAIGIDFGENFANLSSLQFGYTMNYFSEGIQILEPRQPTFNGQQPAYDENGNVITVPDNDPRKYFGSAQITFVFGWMW